MTEAKKTYAVGRVCVKIAGRDAGLKCVIVSTNGLVAEIDGQTRRRKVNFKHLLPTDQTVKIAKGASHSEVKKAFEELKIAVRETKPKKATERPRHVQKKRAPKLKQEKKATVKQVKPEKTEPKAPVKPEAKKTV